MLVLEGDLSVWFSLEESRYYYSGGVDMGREQVHHGREVDRRGAGSICIFPMAQG